MQNALSLLENDGVRVGPRAFLCIQGESDSDTLVMSRSFKGNLKRVIREIPAVLGEPTLHVLPGMDEQHQAVQKNPIALSAQKELEQEMEHVRFTSMIGLEKVDTAHLTPKGLEEHGRRLYVDCQELCNSLERSS